MLCDSNIERYIRKDNYEKLNKLTSTKRFTEKFKLETEALKLDIKETDEIIGWFYFDKNCDEEVIFADEAQTPETADVINAPEKFSSRTNVDRGHTLIDYKSILNNGLIFYQKRIDEEIQKYPKNEYLLAMRDSLSVVLNFIKQIAAVIDIKATTREQSDQERLVTLKDMIDKVPYYPAETFCEAVQAVWIIHFLIPLAENAWYSISLGKFDEYMYPFYRQSLKDGMTREDAKNILYNLYQLLNSYADGACLLNIGPTYNELSELII